MQNVLETTDNISGLPRTSKRKYDIASLRYLFAESYTNKINHKRKMIIKKVQISSSSRRVYLALKDLKGNNNLSSQSCQDCEYVHMA